MNQHLPPRLDQRRGCLSARGCAVAAVLVIAGLSHTLSLRLRGCSNPARTHNPATC
jgi:hypothetical protein